MRNVLAGWVVALAIVLVVVLGAIVNDTIKERCHDYVQV